MKKMLLGLWMLLLAPGIFTQCAREAAFSVAETSCEQQQNPLGLETQTPRFSWQVMAQERSYAQGAYQILVADSPEALAREKGNCWNSGKVRSAAQILIPYAGEQLLAGRPYWWKVRVWDLGGKPSPWSQPATFSMGLLSEQDWAGARWIALQGDIEAEMKVPAMHSWEQADQMLGRGTPFGMYTMPQFRRAFTAAKPVARATVYVCGLGQFELFVNGTKSGDHFLDPAWTAFDKEAQYVTFDITSQLQGGENVLGVMLGNGFFNIPRERYFKLLKSYGAPKMILKAEIEYEDGTRETIVSDESWRVSPSAVTYSSIYGGEDFDASTEQQGWKSPRFDDASWKEPLLTGFKTALRTQGTTPLIISDRIPTVRYWRNGAGNWTYDLGQSASGIVRLEVKASGAKPVKLIPAELILENGTANQRASGDPFYYVYTPRGDGQVETWQPQFTYYGYRYVEVVGAVPAGEANPQGLPEVVAITGLHTRNSAEIMGEFSCSNPLFNKIHTLIDWAVRSNLSHVLTDCPHREKLGWLEVAHLMGTSIQFRYDISRLYPKKVGDMHTAQHDNGMIPTIAPEYVTFSGGFEDTPEWGSAYVIIPWQLYQWYGDSKVLEDNYADMARYVDYLGSRAEGHIVSYGLGDWFDIGPDFPGYAQLTTNGVTATAIYYHNVQILQKASQLLGKAEEAARYEALAAEIKQAYNKKFWNPETRKYDRDSQTANAISLYMGLVPEENIPTVVQNMIGDIRARGNALTAGDVGYHFLLKALEDNGASEVIYDMNSRYDVPGYGYQLAHGATCLTESWQAYPQVSNNHCMLGHLTEWLYSGLAGISQTPASVAYKEVMIRPQVVGDIYEARGAFQSPYGLIRSEWKDSPQQFTQLAEIPAGSTALVYLPPVDPGRITESGLSLDDAPGVALLEQTEQHTIVRTGAGTYHFVVEKE